MFIDSLSYFAEAELNCRIHAWANFALIKERIRQERIFEGAYCGTYSLTVPRLKTTYVSQSHLWYGQPVSASAVARRILAHGLKQLNRKRIPWNKQVFPMLSLQQPMYAMPTDRVVDLYYFDIKSCFYAIYSRLTLDFWFHGNFAHWGDLRFTDFMPKDLVLYKLCRNSLVGVMRCATSHRVRGGKIVELNTTNSVLSPCHWGFIAHLLHAIAQYALLCGAIYYNTDGAIFPTLEAGLRWVDFVRSLGFTADLKAQGKGEIRAIGSYDIGLQRVGSRVTKKEPYNNLFAPSDKIIKDWCKNA